MTTIHLEVKVPDGFVMPKKIVVAPADDNSRDAMKAIEWKEIHLPTDEEIEIMSKAKPILSGHICNRKYGAKWVINKIKSDG